VSQRTEEETKTLEEYRSRNAKVIAETKLAGCGVYAVAFQPDGKLLAAAGADGVVRLIDTASGQVVRQVAPAPIRGETTEADPGDAPTVASLPQGAQAAGSETETLPKDRALRAIEVLPAELRLVNRFDVAQLVVTGTLDTGETIDVTRMVETRLSADVAE